MPAPGCRTQRIATAQRRIPGPAAPFAALIGLLLTALLLWPSGPSLLAQEEEPSPIPELAEDAREEGPPDEQLPESPEGAPTEPTSTPAPIPPRRSHDWRSPGFVAAVGGQLFDPDCVPLRSVGSNAPNLPYRVEHADDLDWLRRHNVRWVRVFASGHALGPDRTPRDAATAVQALQRLVARVEAHNTTHSPAEAIYLLVTLTDYYPPSVPGDRHAYDHPFYRDIPILAAPWYRAGRPFFDFQQEHGFGRLTDLPNYELYFKPWVREVVRSVADSPAILGWQIGNEMKARGSPPNGFDSLQAFDWYLAFTRDTVDTIRAVDRHHLIFLGVQHIAELLDLPYRPDGVLQPNLLPQYRQLHTRLLEEGCGESCWNVWGFTVYDFNPYPWDDAALLQEAKVAGVFLEYGFSLGRPDDMAARYGGDRARAVGEGFARPWQTLDGATQPRLWGALESVERLGLAGIAPWGSPVPGPEVAYDTDTQSGITAVPDQAAMWDAWREVGAALEAANRAAGPSDGCLAAESPPPGPPPAMPNERIPLPLAEQPFQGGHLLARPDTGIILATFEDGTWTAYTDTFDPAAEEPEAPVAPPGLDAPRRGFGALWRREPALRERLGWATAPERGFVGEVQPIATGLVFWTGAPNRLARVYFVDGTTHVAPDTRPPR